MGCSQQHKTLQKYGWRLRMHYFLVNTQVAQARHHIKECMGKLNCPQNVLKCNKIVHPAQLTCVVVISCVSGAFKRKIAHTFLYMTFPIAWATCG